MSNEQSENDGTNDQRQTGHEGGHESDVVSDLAKGSHTSSMALHRGVPQALWASYRLGSRVYALCADIAKAERIDIWVCARLEDVLVDGKPVACWRATSKLETTFSKDRQYDPPESWTSAAQAGMTLLLYPTDEWSGYVIEGIDA